MDQKLGIHEMSTVAHVFFPGYTELASCFLRLALTTELALKRSFVVGYGPPSLVCNWSDRTAAAALAMSHDGVFFSCLLEDLMLQTSLMHVADVMCMWGFDGGRSTMLGFCQSFRSFPTALLGSFKALLESYVRMHEEKTSQHIDSELVLDFIRRLMTCPHYVVGCVNLNLVFGGSLAFSTPFKINMFALRWTYECLDFFNDTVRQAILGLLVSGDVMPQILCHWEANVRHLFIALVVYRFVPPASLPLHVDLLNSLRTFAGESEERCEMS